jgi:hypothetical protein
MAKRILEISINLLEILRTRQNYPVLAVNSVTISKRLSKISKVTAKTLDVISENMYNGCYIHISQAEHDNSDIFLITSHIDGYFSLATRAGGSDVFQCSLSESERNELT